MSQTPISEAIRKYNEWLNDPSIDEATKAELRGIAGQSEEIEDRFGADLAFGTAGLRGVMGAGTRRMNIYTVRRATQGLADYLNSGPEGRSLSVAIAYDSRHHSGDFALEAALVLAGNGIKALLFESLRPTPELSFAVRKHQADAGIVVTASHNPPKYNGYKVYGPDGGQLVPEAAERLTRFVENVKFGDVRRIGREQAEASGLLVWLGEETDREYVSAVIGVSRRPEELRAGLAADLTVVYTPLHGTGNRPVQAVLNSLGFSKLHVVAEQERPDPNFSTVRSPNPEEREAFALAIELAKRTNADLILGTDPDCDRMGAAVKDSSGDYVVLSGNQLGALMIHYLLSDMKSRGELPANGVIIQTIVTGELGAKIAERHGVGVMRTLTGFKYIGEKMTEFEKTGQYRFLFGYEESYGYLAGTHARDKDAVVACMLLSEAAAYYKSLGLSLSEVLQQLYDEYGYYMERLESRTFEGTAGMAKMGEMMDEWRHHPPEEVAGIRVIERWDYSKGINGLPQENVLKFALEDGSWLCLRPSGTEPKMKMYFGVKQPTKEESARRLEELAQSVMSRIDD
jgi:phosphoglucomutase